MVELKRSLGYPALIAMTLTAMIGTGMFFGTSIAAKYSGNASLIAWVLMGIIAMYVGMCFAELAGMFPGAGGVYEYTKKAYGRFPSFLIGWTTWIVTNVATTVLIVAGTNYLFSSVNTALMVSLILILILNIIAYRGVEASTKVVIFFAIVTIITIFAILIPGPFLIQPHHYEPFLTSTPLMIFVSLFFIMESLMGWETAGFLGEETKNPETVIPRSIIISTIIAIVIAIAIPVITLGVIPWQNLSGKPFLDMATTIYGIHASNFFIIAIAITLIGAAAGSIVANPRLLLALARDKLFIEQLADIHPKYRTPYKAILFQMFVSVVVLFIGFGVYEDLISLLVPLALLMYIFVLLALVILRFKEPNRLRTYKAPFGKVLPFVVILFYLAIIGVWLFTDPNASQLFRMALSLIFFGIPIYLLLTFYYNPQAVIGFNNSMATISMKMENLFLPRKIRKQILAVFKNIEGRTILEYGAGVGTLTAHLMEQIGPKGKVYAIDASPKNLKLLGKRLIKEGITNLQLIHDEHQFTRIHPAVQHADMAFSVGMLGYIQNPQGVLRSLSDIMPEHGRICFVDYIDFFKILPNPKWLNSDEEIRAIFKEAGFSVEVKKVHGFFWNYIFVYGIKTKYDVPFV
jgi:basic amino acid/polyamine antiporter, APA family